MTTRYTTGRLYHATPSANVPSIRAHGIRLSRGPWEHYPTPRVYLTDDTNITYIFAAQLLAEYPEVDEVSVLEVDAPQVGAPMHDDPDWYDGTRRDYIPTVAYVEAAIPASAVGRVVEVYDRSDFDERR